jgi:hypothetical protein
MTTQMYLLADAARTLDRKPYQIAYAITSGLVPDVGLRIGGRRVFRAADIERLRRHFSNKDESLIANRQKETR